MIAGDNSLDAIQDLENSSFQESDGMDRGGPSPTQGRLARYGSQALSAVRYFAHIFFETLSNMGTALAGSIIMLPVVIVIRAIQVVLGNFFESLKTLLLSILRALFDGLRYLISPLHEAFSWYNQQILKPLLKQIQEDDTTALVAFGVLVLIIIGMGMVLPGMF